IRGAVESTEVPELTLLAPSPATVCNEDPGGSGVPQPCPINPTTTVIEAVSSRPSGEFWSPFSTVEFRDGTTYSLIGPTTVSFTDDGVTQTDRYTTTFSGSNRQPGSEAVWVVGYGSPGGVEIYGGFVTVSVAVD